VIAPDLRADDAGKLGTRGAQSSRTELAPRDGRPSARVNGGEGEKAAHPLCLAIVNLQRQVAAAG
jgi:hypothetical protein